MIIVGLGNSGAKYKHNRHNAGFMVLDSLADKNNISFETKKIFQSEIIEKDKTIYAKPTTFMNLSGLAVQALTKQYGNQLAVVYDDIDIPIGTVKCSFGRGSGDHNGLQSVIDHLGHKDFFRVRVGVRPVREELISRIAPPDGFEKFLLSDFTPLEEQELKEGIEKAEKIISELSTKSFEEIMNKYN